MPHPDAMTTCCRLKSAAWSPYCPPPPPDDDDEEFFEASPENSTAATEEGRAKLYELLQQHAADDAHEVFYDVEACCEPSAPPTEDEHPVPNGHVPTDTCKLQVFTEERPLITRSTSLKTGKTPPGTPSRKKIVRFADVLGLDLEDVRHIISGDMPNVPSSAFDDLHLDDVPPAAPGPTVELPQRTWGEASSGAPNALYPKFAMPGHQPDFMDRIRSRGVCLENVVIAEFTVQGTCRVMNWGFNKRVVVRYTTNHWASSSDIPASHVAGSTRDGTDSFAFNLFLTPFLSSVEFALRYDVNGREHWDNNGGNNYRVSRHGDGGMTAHNVSVPCSPTWMQDFW